MEIKNNILRWWYNKDPYERKKTQRNALIGAAVISILVFIQVKKYSSNGEEAPEIGGNEQTTEIALTDQDSALLLEKDIAATARNAVQSEVGNVNTKVAEAIKQQLGSLTTQPEVTIEVPTKTASLQPSQPNRQDFSNLKLPDGVTIPQPQASNGRQFSYTPSSQPEVNVANTQPVNTQPKWVFKGAIDSGGASAADYGVKPQTDNKRVKEIELPVGFMKARLLVGINARSGEFGLNNPQQVVFHVSAPAQLPNRIKMDLAGCFVVANVHGDLSASRIEALPVSMNCLTNDGKYKIESAPDSIKGFVQDGDGKRGLDARVVSKARHLLAGSLFANTITGFGEVVAAQGVTQSISPTGTVNTINNEELAKSAGAKGLAGGFKDLGDYLLDLARQMQPTLEQGAGKPVLVWIAETAVLQIEELKK